jgi:hypothetical protein
MIDMITSTTWNGCFDYWTVCYRGHRAAISGLGKFHLHENAAGIDIFFTAHYKHYLKNIGWCKALSMLRPKRFFPCELTLTYMLTRSTSLHSWQALYNIVLVMGKCLPCLQRHQVPDCRGGWNTKYGVPYSSSDVGLGWGGGEHSPIVLFKEPLFRT